MTEALGIDLGTSGVRAALVDADGKTLALVQARIEPAQRRDPQALFGAVGEALAGLGDLGAVAAVAVDGTSGTLLAIDGAGRPVTPLSLYNDPAAPALVQRIAAAAPAESAARGATSPLARLLALQAAPGAVRMLHEADWIAGRLWGEFTMSDENNALKTGYDVLARAWPGWIEGLGVRPEMLPAVVAPGTWLGEVGREGRALGLPPRAIVAAGTTDGCAAFLATGANAPGDAVTSLGSTLTLKLLSHQPVFAPDYGIYSHRLGETWLAGGASNSGGAVLARFFDADRIAALSATIDPAEASGLEYYPLLSPGERFPINDPALAPRLTPRPADDARFLHGLLEGIARIEALGYRRLAALGAPAPIRLRTVGGGANNATWTAMRARLLGVPLMPARATEAAVGTALLALRGTSSRSGHRQETSSD